MGETTLYSSARELVDSQRILDVLLRRLVQKASVTSSDLATVLGLTIRKVLDTVHAQAITIFMVEREQQTLTFKHVYYSPTLYGKDPQKKQLYENRAKQLEAMTLDFGTGLVGDAIRTGKPVLIGDARRDERFYANIDEQTGFVTQSVLAVPLKIGEEVVGCIQAINKCADGTHITEFTAQDVYLLGDVASYTAKVIQRALHPAQPFSDLEMAHFVARLTHCPFLELNEDALVDFELLRQIGEPTLRQCRIVPLAKLSATSVKAALANPLDLQALSDFETLTGLGVTQKVITLPSQIDDTISRAFAKEALDVATLARIKREFSGPSPAEPAGPAVAEEENASLILQLSHSIIEDAFKKGASDIHLEPLEDKTLVRYRVDGVCVPAAELPKALHEALVNRFKVMSQLNISERRLPQDGRITFKKFSPQHDIDLRLSTAPMHHGEKLCLRIFDKTKATLSLDRLGFSAYNLARYRQVIQAPYGMVLHCGPTGSGKSLTLYSVLNELNQPQLNIATAEDPVEYTLPGINQMAIRADIGLTFARALRCFLRQDPDIILVGEMRDQETAEIAIEAALTGHLVFSTLHTNDAPSSISRLMEMRVPPYMISTALICICAQRLLRRLCAHCKVPAPPSSQEREFIQSAKDGLPLERVFWPGTCQRCGQSGYQGRAGIHELMCINDELRELISRQAPVPEIKQAARRNAMRTLFEDAMEKVKAGITSFAEAIGTVRPD